MTHISFRLKVFLIYFLWMSDISKELPSPPWTTLISRVTLKKKVLSGLWDVLCFFPRAGWNFFRQNHPPSPICSVNATSWQVDSSAERGIGKYGKSWNQSRRMGSGKVVVWLEIIWDRKRSVWVEWKSGLYLSNKTVLIVHSGLTYLATHMSGYRGKSKHVTPCLLISWKDSSVIDWKQGNNPASITCLTPCQRMECFV